MNINGTMCVSTGMLGALLNLNVSEANVIAIGIQPFHRGPVGIYWREDDVPLIAIRIAKRLLEKADHFGLSK